MNAPGSKKLNIVFSAFGTRGDAQPAGVMAREAKSRGHDVKIIVSRGLEDLARTFDVPFEVYPGPTAQEQFGKLDGKLSASSEILKRVQEHISVQAKALPNFAKGADILVGNALEPVTASVAEVLGIPYIRIVLTPIFGGENRPSMFPLQRMPGWANRILWKLVDTSSDFMLKPHLNRARKELGLSPIKKYKTYNEVSPSLLCLDERLAPAAPQWPENITRTGYPFLESKGSLPEDLLKFLDEGPPPIYIGFGSMGNHDPEGAVNKLLKATANAGLRALVAKGWADLVVKEQTKNVFEIGAVPHDLLFPRLAGVIHHGGAGTTHTAAMAGVPQLLVPHITDQFYYAQSIFENLLGPAALPFSKLNLKDLTKRLVQLKNFQDRARTFAENMDRDGARRVVDQIESYV